MNTAMEFGRIKRGLEETSRQLETTMEQERHREQRAARAEEENARAEEEKARAEEEKARAEETRDTTLSEYIEACHDAVFTKSIPAVEFKGINVHYQQVAHISEWPISASGPSPTTLGQLSSNIPQ